MIINRSAYGLDSTYNAIRLAANLAQRGDVEMTVFLMEVTGSPPPWPGRRPPTATTSSTGCSAP